MTTTANDQYVLLYPVAVAVRLARGEPEEAERACRRVEDSTSWFLGRAWIGTAHEVRGLLARASGDRARAADQLTRARSVFAALGQPFDEARCVAALASVVEDTEAAELVRCAKRRYREWGVAEA